MTQHDPHLLDLYFDVVARTGRTPDSVRFYLKYLFRGVDLTGSSMLDVGAGDGLFSFYAACMGATKVVSLEPEAAGSSAGTHENFDLTASLLERKQVHFVPQRLQDYEPGDESFDVLLLHASINHLNEDACVRLHRDREAQNMYLDLFRRLAALAKPGAVLIPFAPMIEWQKHQSPELWARLLAGVGFTKPVIRWNSFNTLRSFGRVLLGNRIAAYCLTSSFCLTMEKDWPRSMAR